jgi:hypothetical protein
MVNPKTAGWETYNFAVGGVRRHAEMAGAGLPGIPGIAADMRWRVRAADVEVIEVK